MHPRSIPTRGYLALVALLVSTKPAAGVLCTGTRNVPLCAQYITPFSANNYTWQANCGVNMPATDILMAEQLLFNTGACPSGTTATCCTPCLACGNVGVDCDGPATALPPASIVDPDLPDGWSVAIPCAVDDADRVLENIMVTYLASTTPSSCVKQCADQGFTFAGVEYSDECYCGTGYIDGIIPSSADVADCNMRCAGDFRLTCGGSWRIQLYKAV